MNWRITTVTLIIVLALVFSPAVGQVEDWQGCKFVVPIDLSSKSDQPIVRFELRPGINDQSKNDLSDLRVVNQDAGIETGYIIEENRGKTTRVKAHGRIYHRMSAPGVSCSAMMEFGKLYPRARIRVSTSGEDFLRKIQVEGSNDQEKWEVLRDVGYLFNIPKGKNGWRFEQAELDVPTGSHRYLRVKVFNGPKDPKIVNILGVEVFNVNVDPPDLRTVDVMDSKVSQEKKTTLIELDLGYRNVPLHELTLDFADENFFRRVEIQGRDAAKKMIERRMEDGGKKQAEVDVPYRTITTGAIHRITTAQGKDESLTISLNGAKARHLLVKIENLDDSPLTFKSAKADRYTQWVAFKAEKGQKDFALYYYNPNAKKPSYDLAHFIDALKKDGVFDATLKEQSPNTYQPKEKAQPFSEQYSWLIWIVLLAVLVVLTGIVVRQMRSAAKSQ